MFRISVQKQSRNKVNSALKKNFTQDQRECCRVAKSENAELHELIVAKCILFGLCSKMHSESHLELDTVNAICSKTAMKEIKVT